MVVTVAKFIGLYLYQNGSINKNLRLNISLHGNKKGYCIVSNLFFYKECY